MWLDITLSVALAIVTIAMAYLGVHVTLHPAESTRTRTAFKAGFSACAIVAVGLVIWQGTRNGMAQRQATGRIDVLGKEISDAKREAQNVRADLQSESARRQQAERDLAIIVQGTGQTTRAGISDDLKKTPFKVQVSGLSTTVVNQSKMSKLAGFVADGNRVKQNVPATTADQTTVDTWLASVERWWKGAEGFLGTECTPQALAVGSDLTRMVGMSYSGIHQDKRVQGTFSNLDHLIGNLTDLLKRPDLCP